MITALCSAMESKKQLQQYENHWLSSTQEITAVTNPWCVRYFTQDHIVVGGINGAVHSINLRTQKIQKRIGATAFFRGVTLQSNNKQVITCKDTTITVYSSEKIPECETFQTEKNEIRSFAWNSLKNTIFLCYGENRGEITQYNYVTRDCKNIPVCGQICQIMTMHPKKEIMCIADHSGNISLYNIDDTFSKIKIINLNTKLKKCWFCQYSPDGSYIVAGNEKKLFIIDPDRNVHVFPCIKAEKKDKSYETFKNVAFYRNDSILAILCNRTIDHSRLCVRQEQFVRYFDLKTQQFIDATPKLYSQDSYDLCFSDDGLEVMVALKDKCVRMHVPFAIKEKCLYYLCVLNRIKDHSKWPNDIVRYCGNMLLELFKF